LRRRSGTTDHALETPAVILAMCARVSQTPNASRLWEDSSVERAEDEVRPVTALFADIVGSTALGERLSAEEVIGLVGECVSRMSSIVEEHGGTVQAYMGDGICAYFGVPVAHEDDPERAAHAALRILDVIAEYQRDIAGAWAIEGFSVRVGINTGQAAVGLVGAADPQAVALGDTTNVAARLQAGASPATIVVGEITARLLGKRFAVEPLGEVNVKGRTAPVRAWRLVSAEMAQPAQTRTPLVGREDEVTRLRAAAEELAAGRGQVLLLVGEPGIGKSRLLLELRSLLPDDVTWLEGHCLSYGGLPSWPFAEILRAWLGVEDRDPEVAVRTKARARLGALLDADQHEAFLALGRLLRIRLDAGPQPDPPKRAGLGIRHAYARWIEALTAQRPVVLAVEDVHWADRSSRGLAQELLELTDRAPLLLVATMRPDAASEGWRFRRRVLSDFRHRSTELVVRPLPDEAANELLATLLPGALDDLGRALLINRAEGNPLYLEELLRLLVETGGVERRRRTWTITPGPTELLPPALENLLVARFDKLPEGPRRLAQIAAVIGRTFPVVVLERVAADADLSRNLAALLQAEIVREVRRYPEFECTFKHGLLQEAALTTLTAARRRELFGRVAIAYEEFAAGALDAHLERLAYYYAQSLNLQKALEYLERAGEHAVALDAPTRAVPLLERARAVAAELGDEASENRIEGRLRALVP
jgi:class 3 adenylate cyclase